MGYGPYPWAFPYQNTSTPIAGQTQASYLQWLKTQQFDNVGYFLINYVADGGAVTKNVTRNDQIDISTAEFVLDESLQKRPGVQGLTLVQPNSTYFADIYKGDFWLDTNHPQGTAGTDYLTLATITTDANSNVLVITDTRNPYGGFRLDSQFPIPGVAMNPAIATQDMANFKIINLGTPTGNSDAATKIYIDTSITNYPVNALRQAAINGGFAINQLAKSGTVVLVAGAYGHDMWKAGSSGCTYTFSTVNNVTTITITAGSLQQVIEGSNIYSGNYILSWSGSSQGRINGGSYGAAGVTALLTGGNNTTIEFGPGTVSNVQFNYGSTALPFQPRSFADDLRMCQRFFEKSYDYAVAPGGIIASGSIYTKADGAFLLTQSTFSFMVQKRVAPTVTIYSPQTGASARVAEFKNDGTYNTDIAPFVPFVGETGFRIQSLSGQFTAGNFENFHYVADARL